MYGLFHIVLAQPRKNTQIVGRNHSSYERNKAKFIIPNTGQHWRYMQCYFCVGMRVMGKNPGHVPTICITLIVARRRCFSRRRERGGQHTHTHTNTKNCSFPVVVLVGVFIMCNTCVWMSTILSHHFHFIHCMYQCEPTTLFPFALLFSFFHPPPHRVHWMNLSYEPASRMNLAYYQ